MMPSIIYRVVCAYEASAVAEVVSVLTSVDA